MPRWSQALLCAAIGLCASSAALAGREISGYKPPHEMTEEELAESKAKSRMAVNDYANQVTERVEPIPWLSVAILVSFLVLATPYALRYYNETARASTAKAMAQAASQSASKERERPHAPQRSTETRVVDAEELRSRSRPTSKP